MKTVRSILLALLFCITCGLFSQSRVYTSIQQNEKTYPKKDFNFQKVIDSRKNRENIGLIYKADLRTKYQAEFRKQLPDEFGKFLRKTYPNAQASKHLIMVVHEFTIDHEITDEKKDVGYARGDFEFFLLENDSCYFVHRFTKTISDEARDITVTHPNRMKRLVLLSVNSVDSSLTTLDYKKYKPISWDSLNKKTLPEKENLVQKIKDNTAHDKVFVQLGLYYSFSSQVMLLGPTASFTFRLKNNPQFLVGINGAIKLYGGVSSEFASNNLSHTIFNCDLGIKLLTRLSDQLYLNINPMVVLGNTSENKTSTTATPAAEENLLGLELDFGVYIIPPKVSGLYTGLSGFFRGTNNSVYDSGLGIKLDLGIKF